MSSPHNEAIEPRGPRIPGAIAVAAAVSAAQVGAFYAATFLSSGVRLPIKRGLLLLGVIVAAGALASLAVRGISPHTGSGYGIPLLATAGFILAYFAVVSAGYRLAGVAVLVPAGVGSFIGALIGAIIPRRSVVRPVADQQL